jgi:hypothetical protein
MRTFKPVFTLPLLLLFLCPIFAESDDEPEKLLLKETPLIAADTEETPPEETTIHEGASIQLPAEHPAILPEEHPAKLPENEIMLSDALEDDFDIDDFFSSFNAPDLVFEVPVFEPRSFDDVFPDLSASNKRRVRSASGLRYSFEKDGEATIIPAPDSGINILENFVMTKKPSHVIEALVLIPYDKRELDMLDIYNALGQIKDIKNHTITANNNSYQIFKDTTRLDNARTRKPIEDPEPVKMLPLSETMYIRFTDTYIGELYLRGEISFSLYGVTYSMTNFRDVNYSIFSIMKAERFSAIIYLEPVKEGILIYSASGLYLPSFITKRLNLTANINNRITVLLRWITEGLKRQENLREKPSVPFAVN